MHNTTSPDNSDTSIEREIQAKGKTAPRITPADIANNIDGEIFFTAEQAVQGTFLKSEDLPNLPALKLLTFCVLTLRNGYTVTGKSACASPENYDAEIGRRIARENAVQEIWPLMGYALKEKLAAIPGDFKARVRAEHAELNERLGSLEGFIDGPTFAQLPGDEQERMRGQASAMRTYSTLLSARIGAFTS